MEIKRYWTDPEGVSSTMVALTTKDELFLHTNLGWVGPVDVELGEDETLEQAAERIAAGYSLREWFHPASFFDIEFTLSCGSWGHEHIGPGGDWTNPVKAIKHIQECVDHYVREALDGDLNLLRDGIDIKIRFHKKDGG